MPIQELQHLLSGVSQHGTQHLREVEADLMQTSYLLSEAIGKLGASFLRIHAAVLQQQALMEQQQAQPAADAAGLASQLGQLRQQIDREVDAAVTGLQFQDLTSQLIARVQKRVSGLHGLLSALAEHDDELPPGTENGYEHEAMARLLQQISRNLSLQSDALQDGLRREVSQKHMESGDIELF